MSVTAEKYQDAGSCSALWLDPFQPAGERERACLREAGLNLLAVRTLDDLRRALNTAQLVVIRLKNGVALLTEVKCLIESFKPNIPVLCRTDKQAFQLGIEAMQHGACHVLAHDDYSQESWQLAQAYVKKAVQAVRAGSLATNASAAGPVGDPANGGSHTSSPEATAFVETPYSASYSSSSVHTFHGSGPSVKEEAEAKASQEKPKRTFIFVDPTSQKLLALAQRVAQAEVTTLITGPTGAGKEVLANVIHEASPRAKAPFVSLNCGAIPEHLMEDMLFGHEKGAFTGALKEHKGIFEQAQGGTVFLDEIGELPLNLQAKLLRVLQEKQVTRLGGSQAIDLDFRLVAATNKDLKKAIEEREFREDLYFRISTFRLSIPTLAERRQDILPLAAFILQKYSSEADEKVFSHEAQRALLSYHWPGNVRELENVIQRALIYSFENIIQAEHLVFDEDEFDSLVMASGSTPTVFSPPPYDKASRERESRATTDEESTGETDEFVGSLLPMASKQGEEETVEFNPSVSYKTATSSPQDDTPAPLVPPKSSEVISLNELVKTNEKQMIIAAIEASPTKVEAARRLGISPRTLRYKMAQLRMAGAA
jgi:two-component system response regulator FlrC